jgi:hypothetical protein
VDGKLTFANLEAGLYLVSQPEADTNTITVTENPYLILLPSTDESTSEYLYDVTSIPKYTSDDNTGDNTGSNTENNIGGTGGGNSGSAGNSGRDSDRDSNSGSTSGKSIFDRIYESIFGGSTSGDSDDDDDEPETKPALATPANAVSNVIEAGGMGGTGGMNGTNGTTGMTGGAASGSGQSGSSISGIEYNNFPMGNEAEETKGAGDATDGVANTIIWPNSFFEEVIDITYPSKVFAFISVFSATGCIALIRKRRIFKDDEDDR